MSVVSGLASNPSVNSTSVQTANGNVEVSTISGRVFRIRLFGPPEVPDSSFVQAHGPGRSIPDDATGSIARTHAFADGTVELATEHGAVRIHPNPLTVAFHDATGRALIPGSRSAPISRETITTSDGRPPRHRVIINLARPAAEETHIYGLGQGGGGGQLERVGMSRMLWNSHHGHGPGTDMAVPLLVYIGKTCSFGVFFDTTASARVDVQRSDGGSSIHYEAETSSCDLYLIAGPSPQDVLHEYGLLTGLPPMPPKWSLGFIQSSRHWDDEEEIRALAQNLRDRRIPCDAIVFLSTYGEAKSWNVGVGHLDIEPDLIPDPKRLFDELQNRWGFQLVTHEYPVVHPKSTHFPVAEARGYIVPLPPVLELREVERGPVGITSITPTPLPNPSGRRPAQNFNEGQRLIDFSQPEARTWWWDEHRHLVDLGVAGWWLDGAEGPPATAELAGGSGRLLHNVYAMLRMQAFHEGEARDRPHGRPWLLCRSGGAGMQRYAGATWSGDINTTFATFEAQLPLGLNTAMSGVPYWGTDIGGFFPAGLTPELYARWFQFGAFCPVFRSHGWEWRQHVPWAHGDRVEGICRTFGELRMQLLPYIYGLAWQAHSVGEPIMQPLAYRYPADPNVWELGSQFMFGPSLLVAPVTRAGATSWPVYLPEGDWYDFWTHERHHGLASVSIASPLETCPVMVRRGAIIPMTSSALRTADQANDQFTLLIYPPAPGQTSSEMLYEDDGSSQAYSSGGYSTSVLSCSAGESRMTVHIGAARGTFTGQAPLRQFSLRIRTDDKPAGVSGTGVHSWEYHSPFVEVVLAPVAFDSSAEIIVAW